jgi:hypothetical protein
MTWTLLPFYRLWRSFALLLCLLAMLRCGMDWYSHGTWWRIRPAHFRPVFGDEAVQRGLLFLEQGSIRALLRVSSSISPRHETAPHLVSMPLKHKPAARDTRAPRAPSIVGSFCLLPSREYVAGSVAPAVCPLVLAAARGLPAALREGAQSDNRRATTPDGPAGVELAVQLPTCGVSALRRHAGRSNSPAQ